MKLKHTAFTLLVLLFCSTANAQSGRKSVQREEPPKQTVEGKKEGSKDAAGGEIQPVKIYRRPAPDASVAADCHRREGLAYLKTVLRVAFDAAAVISAVEIKQASGCREFDEESVDAARRIKFEPAVQNGKPITVIKTVIYQGGIARR